MTVANTNTILAWHLIGTRLRDGRPVPADGEWLEHDGALVMCESGLHASIRLIDALQYAPGATICRVECAGEMLHEDDKLVATRRRILWRVDGEAVLRAFARWCALRVAHLWPMPDVARRFLATGDESLQAAAWAAASSAARAAAWDAVWAAARAAVWAAASSAARAAASSAASSAAWDAQNEQLERMVEEARAGRAEWIWQAALDAGEEA